MKKTKWLAAATLLGATAFLGSCDDKNDDNNKPSPAVKSELTLEFTGLEPLGNDFDYESWIIVDGKVKTAGVFDIGSDGKPDKAPTASAEDVAKATAYILTIEPSPDNDPAPSKVHVLAGSFSGDEAALSVGDSRALGTDFSDAKGSFIITAPTTEASGVWFLDNSGSAPSAGLDLPTLADGWKYEGWVVVDGTPISTGTFTSPSGADEFSDFSGPLPGPPFPGEDLLKGAPAGVTFPMDLRGAKAVVSVEPDPDDSPAPFTFKPLVADIAESASLETPIDMMAQAFPISGTVNRANVTTDTTAILTLDIQGLPELGDGYIYEGWVIDRANPQVPIPTTTGTFSVTGGNLSATSFTIDEDAAFDAEAFVISIEPVPDDSPLPAATKILGGQFVNDGATLVPQGTMTPPDQTNLANSEDFSQVSGKFILATPTDDISGLWWLDPTGPKASLTLPTLPAGWKYEGWAVINGNPISTGTFTSPSGADSFSGFSGPLSGPPFPGEDFIANGPSGVSFPADLRGATAVISVEPDPDNSPAPFALKPLAFPIATSAAPKTPYTMNNNNKTNPSGKATRKEVE